MRSPPETLCWHASSPSASPTTHPPTTFGRRQTVPPFHPCHPSTGRPVPALHSPGASRRASQRQPVKARSTVKCLWRCCGVRKLGEPQLQVPHVTTPRGLSQRRLCSACLGFCLSVKGTPDVCPESKPSPHVSHSPRHRQIGRAVLSFCTCGRRRGLSSRNFPPRSIRSVSQTKGNGRWAASTNQPGTHPHAHVNPPGIQLCSGTSQAGRRPTGRMRALPAVLLLAVIVGCGAQEEVDRDRECVFVAAPHSPGGRCRAGRQCDDPRGAHPCAGPDLPGPSWPSPQLSDACGRAVAACGSG